MDTKKAVITLHGIRTYAKWQKDLDPQLAKNDIVPYPLDYGYFDTFSFLNPRKHEEQVTWLRREYERVVAESGVKRPSIIAHSFGTYLTAEMLSRYAEVKLDKIIFTGSIVPRDYDWIARLEADQVLGVHNDYATEDPWPLVASCIPWLKAGASGRTGFKEVVHPRFTQLRSSRGHEVAAFATAFARWVGILRKPVLCRQDADTVQHILALIPPILSRTLGIPERQLRCNVFVMSENGHDLVIPHGAYYNMDEAAERGIRIRTGMGCTGKAYKYRVMQVGIFRDGWWGEHDLPPDQLGLVNRNLRWIVSLPVSCPIDGRIRAILNMDCVGTSKTVEELFDDGSGGNPQRAEQLQKMYGDIGKLVSMLADHLVHLEQGVL
jgi:pimeloyl-ACP methyl ester carboxylesterase